MKPYFKIQSNTRRYARKQLTWYKKDTAFSIGLIRLNIEEILKLCPYNDIKYK